MGFRVITDTSGASDEYYDGSKFFITDGYLVVARVDGIRVTYSHLGWIRLEDDGKTIVRQDPELTRAASSVTPDPLGGP